MILMSVFLNKIINWWNTLNTLNNGELLIVGLWVFDDFVTNTIRVQFGYFDPIFHAWMDLQNNFIISESYMAIQLWLIVEKSFILNCHESIFGNRRVAREHLQRSINSSWYIFIWRMENNFVFLEIVLCCEIHLLFKGSSSSPTAGPVSGLGLP